MAWWRSPPLSRIADRQEAGQRCPAFFFVRAAGMPRPTRPHGAAADRDAPRGFGAEEIGFAGHTPILPSSPAKAGAQVSRATGLGSPMSCGPGPRRSPGNRTGLAAAARTRSALRVIPHPSWFPGESRGQGFARNRPRERHVVRGWAPAFAGEQDGPAHAASSTRALARRRASSNPPPIAHATQLGGDRRGDRLTRGGPFVEPVEQTAAMHVARA